MELRLLGSPDLGLAGQEVYIERGMGFVLLEFDRDPGPCGIFFLFQMTASGSKSGAPSCGVWAPTPASH